MSKNKIKLTDIDLKCLISIRNEPIYTEGVIAKSNKFRLNRLCEKKVINVLWGHEAITTCPHYTCQNSRMYFVITDLGRQALEGAK